MIAINNHLCHFGIVSKGIDINRINSQCHLFINNSIINRKLGSCTRIITVYDIAYTLTWINQGVDNTIYGEI